MSAQDLTDITVVIVTFNSAHCIRGLFDALSKVPRVIVVDNASSDDTIIQVKRWLPQAQILVNDVNLGFGSANNRALMQIETHYAFLLNPDCKPSIDFFEKLLVAAGQFPDAAILAPQLIRKNGLPEVNYRWPAIKWKSSGCMADEPVCVGFLSGAAMLLNMERMRKIGFFDEQFFLYYEDDDLCHRIFLSREQLILYPHLTLVHESRGSVGGRDRLRSEFIRGYHHAQSKIIFRTKHMSVVAGLNLRYQTLIAAIFLFPLRLLSFQPRYIARLTGRIIGLFMFGANKHTKIPFKK
jgi:N-acetylglucosaminyl-diphospho-decaprenol L-rhamnosyltransferase